MSIFPFSVQKGAKPTLKNSESFFHKEQITLMFAKVKRVISLFCSTVVALFKRATGVNLFCCSCNELFALVILYLKSNKSDKSERANFQPCLFNRCARAASLSDSCARVASLSDSCARAASLSDSCARAASLSDSCARAASLSDRAAWSRALKHLLRNSTLCWLTCRLAISWCKSASLCSSSWYSRESKSQSFIHSQWSFVFPIISCVLYVYSKTMHA